MDLLNFLVMFIPAGLVLGNSLFEAKHRNQQLQDHMKHNNFMLQMTVNQVSAYIGIQSEAIMALQEKIDAA